MPRIEDIEQFKSTLNSLGNEPEVLRERGEELEDIPPPEEGLPDDLSEMLSETEEEAPEEEAPEEEAPGEEAPEEEADEGPPEEEAPWEEAGGPEEEIPEEEEPPEEPSEAEEEVPGEEEPAAPEEEAPEDFEEAAGEEAPEAWGEEEEGAEEAGEEAPGEEGLEGFDVDEFEIPDIDQELEALEKELGTEEEEEEEAPEEPEAPEAEEEAPTEEEAPEEPEAPEEETPEAEVPSEETPEEEVPSEEAPEAEEAPEPEEAPEEAAPEEEEFEMPDIDQELEELGEEFGAPEEAEEEEAEEAPEEEFEMPGEEEEGAEEAEAFDFESEDFDFDLEDFEEAPVGEEEEAQEAEEIPEAEEEEEAPEEEAPEEEAPEAEPEAPEEEVPSEEAPEEAPEAEEAPTEEEEPPPGEEEEFEIPDIDQELEELGEEFEAPEEAEEEEEPSEAPEEEAFEEPDLGEEEFEFPAFEEEEAEEEAPEEEFPEPGEEEAFEPGEEVEEEEAPAEEEAFEEEEEAPTEEETPTEEEAPEEEEEILEPGEEGEEEAAPEGEEEFEFSDFEAEEVEEPDQFSIDTEDFEVPGEEEEEVPSDEELDEFSLDDLGVEIEETEEEGETEEELNPATAVSGEPVEGVEEFEISDGDFQEVQHTLNELPRNVKLAVEELLGERDISTEQMKNLINMLVAGESAKKIASYAGKLLNRKIEVPKQYEKKTGAEYEAEKQTFAYIFRHQILPILRIVLAGLAVLALLIFLGYRFVYRPIHAQMLYSTGYDKLEEEQYTVADNYFDRASEKWEMKKWYYTYAQGYIDANQYYLAEQTYDELLASYPLDKRGILEYARLESDILSNYEKAEQLLNRYLSENRRDYETLLAAGDNYMRWAQEDPAKYEQARQAYATILNEYGGKSEVLFRMLRYFIRTDNYEEVVRLKNQFQATRNLTVNPHVYAELGGYLLDKNKLDDVRNILFRAIDADETVPAVHYQLSRYFREIEEYGEERKALHKSINYFQESKPLDRRELSMLILAHNRMGEVHYRNEVYLDAEQEFQRARSLYEEAKSRNIVGSSEQFGEIYANLADLYYYVSNDYETALSLYQDAEQNQYRNQHISYRKGFIQYQQGNYEKALLEFHEAEGTYSENKNLMYSTANTLYERGDFFAAQGYYNHLLDILEQERQSITHLMPEERKEHRSLLEFITKTYNNLGVTLHMLSQNEDSSRYAESLRYLARSTEFSDIIYRDQDTMEPTQSIELAYINTRTILYPDARGELQIYDEIPKDMNDLFF